MPTNTIRSSYRGSKSLEVLESTDCDASEDAENEADIESNENVGRAEIIKSDLPSPGSPRQSNFIIEN